jgi:hypothetical protein
MQFCRIQSPSILSGNGTSNSHHSYTFSDIDLNSGKYNYRLRQIDYNGNFEYLSLSNEVTIGVPTHYSLSQNYPNPFNPVTRINYQLPSPDNVIMKIFDINGKEVQTLVNDFQTPGYYSVVFNAGNLSSGIYFYSLKAGKFYSTKRMLLLK